MATLFKISKKSGNRKVKNATKVDVNGEPIVIVEKPGQPGRTFLQWRSKNPDALAFDSILEWKCYKLLVNNSIPFVLKPKYVLQPAFSFDGVTIKAIEILPDFYLPTQDVILDTKGWATDEFKLKAKILKYQLRLYGRESQLVLIPDVKSLNDFVFKIRQNLL